MKPTLYGAIIPKPVTRLLGWHLLVRVPKRSAAAGDTVLSYNHDGSLAGYATLKAHRPDQSRKRFDVFTVYMTGPLPHEIPEASGRAD